MKENKNIPLLTRILTGFLKVFFKLLYHQFSWSYDLVAWLVSLGLWKRWVLTALPYLTGPLILELGHGPGHLQMALHKHGKNVYAVGLDESSQMGRLALLKARRFRISLMLVNGYAQFLPFAPGVFSQIVATFPSEYIFSPQTLQSVFRCLKPGGQLIVLPLAWIVGNKPLEKLAAWLFRVTYQSTEWDNQITHPFTQAGFSVKVEFADLPSSRVAIILATKPKQ